MRKVLITLVMLSLLTTGFLFAGGSQEAEGGPASLIVSSSLWSAASEQKFLLDEVFPEFEKENNCIVKFEILHNDVLLKRARMQSETKRVTTDIVVVHSGYMNEWIDGNYIEVLPIEKWSGRTFSAAFLDSLTSGGKTLFAPVGADVYPLCGRLWCHESSRSLFQGGQCRAGLFRFGRGNASFSFCHSFQRCRPFLRRVEPGAAASRDCRKAARSRSPGSFFALSDVPSHAQHP